MEVGMEEKGLSPGMLLHQSWRIFKSNWFFLVTVFLVGFVILLIPSFLQVWINKPSAFMQGVFAILSILVSLFVTIGWIKVTLKLVKKEKRSFFDLFRGFPVILNLLVANIILFLLLVLVPLAIVALFSSPGIYMTFNNETEFAQTLAHKPYESLGALFSVLFGFVLAGIALFVIGLKFLLTSYFIVDCYEGPIEAMRMSNRASKGVKWDLLALLFLLFIIAFIGLLFFGVGLLVATPIIYLAYASAYCELVETTPWQGIGN
jgi:uncharacterized membrane protein